MTKRVIHTIPTKLPHSSIYLDDLFEIEDLLSKKYSKLPEPLTISFEYEIDGRIVLTTHDELIEHGGYSNNFVVKVLSKGWGPPDEALSIYYTWNPKINLWQLPADQQRAIYGLIEDIFRGRQSISYKLKTIIVAVPPFIITTVSMGILIPCFFMMGYSKGLQKLPYLVPLILIPIFGAIALKSSRINFRFSRQDEKARTEARHQRIEKAIWIMVTAFITAVITHVADKITLLHK